MTQKYEYSEINATRPKTYGQKSYFAYKCRIANFAELTDIAMKRIFALIIALAAISNIATGQKKDIHVFAHRGCWSKNAQNEFIIPENSVAAVAEAKKKGYEGIECDVRYTKDGIMVILHDETLNRTTRNAGDYSKLEKPVRLADLTFEELRRDYILESEDPELRTPVPTLEELLAECKKKKIVPMLHSSVWESYEMAQKMFGDEWICFTEGVEYLHKVRAFSKCTILLSIHERTAEQNIADLKSIGGRCGISSMNYRMYSPEFCKALTDAGFHVQASIFPFEHEKSAINSGITFLLTDRVLPARNWKKIRTR